VTELVLIGFADTYRANEVLAQLQRLQFDWISDIRNGVAVTVGSEGGLRIMRSHLLDPSVRTDFKWEALLAAIMPLPHPQADNVANDFNAITVQSRVWLGKLSFHQSFLRDAAALLRPGHSAILATIDDWRPAIEFLSGYSHFVLHTTINRAA
jgi:uncharacterized membrane protein